MFPDLAVKFKNYAADMGSGFVVIAGFLLAITMVFVMVFARWNGIRNSTSYYGISRDEPGIESQVEESGCITLVVTEKD